ncbi:MAG: Na+/H+ antiporter subunit E [Bacteroidales bacterium]|nr:Na+/H+ antiporter subunit E [Bacteroidales bacterium]
MILANSITLTPEHSLLIFRRNIIYVHWIEVSDENDAAKLINSISAPFENILNKIYE